MIFMAYAQTAGNSGVSIEQAVHWLFVSIAVKSSEMFEICRRRYRGLREFL